MKKIPLLHQQTTSLMFVDNQLRIIVGLGNPGEKYSNTRHNVGFMALQLLAKRENISFKYQPKVFGQIADIGFNGKPLKFLKPQTFMNESGKSIRAALDWFKFSPDELLILVDDMDLPLGRLRLRAQGSSGGHNGLNSAIKHLGTSNFPRLRIGIGAPSQFSAERRDLTISHVLGHFGKNEQSVLNEVLNEVLNSLWEIQQIGIVRASNKINSLQLKK